MLENPGNLASDSCVGRRQEKQLLAKSATETRNPFSEKSREPGAGVSVTGTYCADSRGGDFLRFCLAVCLVAPWAIVYPHAAIFTGRSV